VSVILNLASGGKGKGPTTLCLYKHTYKHMRTLNILDTHTHTHTHPPAAKPEMKDERPFQGRLNVHCGV